VRGDGHAVALVGMGGAGKTVLAAEAAHHSAVRRRFRGGVAWLAVDPGAGVLGLQSDLAQRLGDAAVFRDAGEGRGVLAGLLAGRRVLVVLDNVWERAVLDAFPPDCQILFTSRYVGLAHDISAVPIAVAELEMEQALELLGDWTGRGRAELDRLPAEAICQGLDRLALGVAMAGAMIGGGDEQRWEDVLARLEAADLGRIRADFGEDYPHPTLLAAIELGIDELPDEPTRQRYRELAVFNGRGPFPRSAVEALWAPAGISTPDAGDLLTLLERRSLIHPEAGGRYTLHDLQATENAREGQARQARGAAHHPRTSPPLQGVQGHEQDDHGQPQLGRTDAAAAARYVQGDRDAEAGHGHVHEPQPHAPPGLTAARAAARARLLRSALSCSRSRPRWRAVAQRVGSPFSRSGRRRRSIPARTQQRSREMSTTHTTIDTPFGELTLVADDGTLSGVYFPGHWTRPDPATFGERSERGFEEVERQLAEYFAGDRTELRAADIRRGRRLPAARLGAHRSDPLRADDDVRGARTRARQADARPQGRCRRRPQPALGDRPVSPRRRRGRKAHRLRRRPTAQAGSPRSRSPARDVQGVRADRGADAYAVLTFGPIAPAPRTAGGHDRRAASRP